ncbi:hypothetical protein NP233_g5230 [Leucocoprinus birnbaumii]|uniref:Endoplasmic reticulum junction formation protein lunapark n=1 Tax=Leucocoprinus birnbaumii TaxID=56174 RepID=A0AAD5VT99_9AGAR|nr:hypothetical protein NP233_g5230 [Leucocoprinus birnbaumii]
MTRDVSRSSGGGVVERSSLEFSDDPRITSTCLSSNGFSPRRAFKREEDFKTILASLADDIQKRQTKLSEIRLREKRSTLLATLYTLLAWLVYTSLWYLDILPSIFQPTARKHAVAERAVRGLPVFIGPIIILFIRRIFQVWYTRKGDAEEKTLKSLMKERRAKVDEIKKKTNFDSMVKLFQEYGEPPAGATPLRNRLVNNQFPVTPQRQGATPGNPQSPVPPTLQAQLTPIPSPYPMAPPRKQWYDKVADALLGDDDHDIGSPSSRYALICDRCFTHNGLVKESMWEDAQFICRNPRCNHFNRSARSKRGNPSANASPHSNLSPPSITPSSSRRSNQHSPEATPSPPPRPASGPDESSVRDSDPDVPTVDSIDAGHMEVDS